jgi:hypothetical protein
VSAAADPDKRRGVLMLAPGGPGGSGPALSDGPLFKQTRYPKLAQTWQATSLSVTCDDVAWPKDVTAYRQGVLGAGRCCARSSVTGRGWSASTTAGTACTSWATTPAR